MRLKGISWVEQHFEKVFAAVFGVAAVAVLTWQFAGKPNAVTVGPRKDVPLDQAYDDIVAAAKRTKEQVERTTPEVPVLPEGGDPISQFTKSYRAPISPRPALAFAPGRADADAGPAGQLSVRANPALAKPVFPAPGKVIADGYMSTIAPSEAADPDVAAVLPPAAPFDKASVTVEARYDGKALRAAMENDPDGPGPIQPMQRNWWESLQVLATELEREELMPDGTWGKGTKVPAMPGRFSLLPVVDKGVPDAETLTALKVQAAERAAAVRRPEFYDLWMGEQWQPPADRRAADELARSGAVDAKSQAMSRKQDIERRLDAKRNKREEMGPMTGSPGTPPGRDATPDQPPRRPPGGGGGGKGAGGGGGRGGQRGPGRTAPEQPTYTDAQRQALDREIADLEKQLAEANKELGIAPTQEATAAPVGGAAKAEPSVLESEDLRLWAHDVGVERGKTYRYRMTLVFNNPLFGRGSVMVPEQAEWARTTLARSEPSAWSDPVQVDSESYWFITSANQPGAAHLSRSPDARAEVYVFTMGYWRQGGATIEPGDRIEADVSVPDAKKLAELMPTLQPDQAPQQPLPGAEPPMTPDYPGAPGGPGSGGGGKRSGGGARPVGPRGLPQEPEKTAAPEAAQIPMITRKVKADATLLGVGSASLSGEAQRQAMQAFVRLGDGSVRVVRPDLEKTQTNYLRVSRSADAAKVAAMPKERERAPEQRPEGERPGRGTPPPPPGAEPPGGAGGG